MGLTLNTCIAKSEPLYSNAKSNFKNYITKSRVSPAVALEFFRRGRSGMKLHELNDNEGANRKKKRVGRGPGSGKGKTAGRGMKGQKSRSGVAINGYEGGQMPLYQRLPKRGFNKPNRKRFAVINVGLLQKFIDSGKLSADAEITEDELVTSGLVRRKLDGIRILAKGDLTSKVDIRVTGASKAAIESIEKVGGTINVLTRALTSEK